jgi:hypothetical protein
MKTEIIKYKNYSFKIFVDPNMRDYSNDPTVKKRAEEAKEFLRKHPLPGHPLKK